MYLYSADWSVSSLYLDPVVLLIQVKGSVVLAAKTSVGALHRVSIGIVVLTYQSPGRRFLRKVSVLLAQAVSWIRTNRVFVSDVGYPVQETFDFVLALFEPFNSCSLERHNRLRVKNKAVVKTAHLLTVNVLVVLEQMTSLLIPSPSYLLTFLLNGRRNNFLQILPGLFHPLVNQLPFALRRLQPVLQHGNLIWRQLAPVLLQKLFSTCDDLM